MGSNPGTSIIDKLKGYFGGVRQTVEQKVGGLSDFISTLGQPQPPPPLRMPIGNPSPTPQPTPTPQPVLPMGRNPQMPVYQRQNPQSFSEIQSGIQQATDNPTLQNFLMDLALRESSMQTNPPPNPLSTARGPFQYLNGTAAEFGLSNPTDATAAAALTAKLIGKGQMSRWNEPLKKGSRNGAALNTLYTPEEISSFRTFLGIQPTEDSLSIFTWKQ